jgi:hypothetical protein
MGRLSAVRARYKAFPSQSQIQSRSLSGFVMVCQVFSAFWNTTIGRNNHFNHKQTRDLDWLTDPLPPLLEGLSLFC